MKFFFSRFLLRKIVLTFICQISQSQYAAIASKILMDLSIAIGEKVSSQLISCLCLKLFATNLVLQVLTWPTVPIFFLKIHLQPIGVTPSDKLTKVYIWLFIMKSILDFMIFRHLSESLLIIASKYINGSSFSMILASLLFPMTKPYLIGI